MKRFIGVLALVVATFLATSCLAVTLIVSQTGEGEIQQMWIDGSKIRIDMSEETSYILINAKEKNMTILGRAD